jgi:dGTPase
VGKYLANRANSFCLLTREEHESQFKLEKYATPYPNNSHEENRDEDEKISNSRNSFIRDRDRIVHSYSFRKLQGKTQVFISGYNPLVRNRLTHTLEVWQISISLARMLKANVDLTEAIALGHDLGHTPFGHSGEAALDYLMRNRFGGFTHNEQGIRVVTISDDEPNLIPENPDNKKRKGLNLTYSTKEGILKHTDRTADKEIKEKYPSKYGSIEAQIVHAADDIAQNTHDLQDIWLANAIYEGKAALVMADYTDWLQYSKFDNRAISIIIDKLINDVAEESLRLLNTDYSKINNKNIGETRYIDYSRQGYSLIYDLKGLVKDVIQNDQVNKMNSRGRQIIRSLYSLFTKDPFSLPKDIKQNKLSDDVKMRLEDIKHYEPFNLDKDNDVRVVCDYIAGLTDQEAIDILHSTVI